MEALDRTRFSPISRHSAFIGVGVLFTSSDAQTAICAARIPVHLNELSPGEARGTFLGFVYQLGNLIASVNATLQADIAARTGGNYGLALALVAGTVAVIIIVLTALGMEARGMSFERARAQPARAGATP